MPARYLIPLVDDKPCAPPATTHHLVRVMRVRAGAELACFDGLGNIYRARVVAVQNKHVELEMAPHSLEPQHLPSPTFHLVMAVLKGAPMDRAISAAVELGATRISLLNSTRVNVRLSESRLDNKLKHWHAVVQSACEQSGLAHIPQLDTPQNLTDILSQRQDSHRVLMDVDGAPATPAAHSHVTVIIGPEGGFSTDEKQYISAQIDECVSLGPLTLRAETVPSAALAVLRHAFSR